MTVTKTDSGNGGSEYNPQIFQTIKKNDECFMCGRRPKPHFSRISFK